MVLTINSTFFNDKFYYFDENDVVSITKLINSDDENNLYATYEIYLKGKVKPIEVISTHLTQDSQTKINNLIKYLKGE